VSYTLVVAPMGVKFGTEEGTLPNFTPLVQRVALRGEKPKNRHLSKLSTCTFALRALMLPVIMHCHFFKQSQLVR